MRRGNYASRQLAFCLTKFILFLVVLSLALVQFRQLWIAGEVLTWELVVVKVVKKLLVGDSFLRINEALPTQIHGPVSIFELNISHMPLR